MNSKKLFKDLLFLGILCSPLFGLGKELHVGEDQAYKSIIPAIEAADSHDVVYIHSGFYEEGSIAIRKPLSLIGLDYPVISGSNEFEVIQVRSDSVNISGLEIRDVGISYLKDFAAIRVEASEEVSITNNRILNAFFGIYLAKSHHTLVQGNYLKGQARDEHNSGNAIHLWSCTNSLIKDNEVSDHRDGIYLEFVEHSVVVDNISHDNLRYGLHFMFSNNDEYNHNVFKQNGAGVAVMFSKYIEMCWNTFERNWGSASYGLLLKEIFDANIQDNIFLSNSTAIHAEGATRTLFEHNTFQENGWAFNVGGSCMKNIIVHNDFISNTFDIIGSSSANNTLYDNNYWSEYSGYDLDKDRKGDVPHRPVKLFNYIIKRVPEAIVLMRSPFVDLLSVAEKISPVFTPDNVIDHNPSTRKFNDHNKRP